MGPRRSKRPSLPSILLVTNGRRTEYAYLTELKQRFRDNGRFSLSVQVIDGEPDTIIKKLRSPYGNTSAYNEVWLVVDEDQHDRSVLLRTCASLTTKKQQWYAVVSRPCFEAWLVAHYEWVRNYADQKEAQEHFRSLVGKQLKQKFLPDDFPYDAWDEACERAVLAGMTGSAREELPPSPGSGMVHLMHRLSGT